MGKLIVTIADYDGEVSTVTFPGADLTAANIDAQETAMLALRTAMGDIERGLTLKHTEVASVSPHGVGSATDPEAQREEKALVRFYDSVTFEKSTLEIPCVDMSKQMAGHPGYFYKAGQTGHHTDWGTFNTAFVAYVIAAGGNTPIIESIMHVGRNT